MNCDLPIDKLPKGETPYISNGNLNEEFGIITNELGTDTEVALPDDYTLIGDILLDDNRRVLFLTDNTNSKILLKTKQTLSNIVPTSTLLNFNTLHQIEGTFKRNYSNQTLVYWTDNYNPPRWINIDDPLTVTSDNLDMLNIFASYKRPVFTLDAVKTGGSLRSGVYQFFIQYEDSTGNTTDYIGASNMVAVTTSPPTESPVYRNGNVSNTQTNKAISMTLSNLDTNYSRVNLIAVFYKDQIVQTPVKFSSRAITDNTLSFVYSGNESTEDVSIDAITAINARYDTAKTIESYDNVLYMGNLTGGIDLGLQKYVNSISVNWISEQVNHHEGFTNEANIYNKRGFMHDEVYALYISYILKDGSLTKAYHIPGRPSANINKYGLTVSETTDLSVIKNASIPPRTITDINLDEAMGIDPDAMFFQFFQGNNSTAFSWGYSNLGYWQNENEFYPDTDDWDIYTVDPSTGTPVYLDTLREDNVRHHKIPEAEIGVGSSYFLDSSHKDRIGIKGLKIYNIPIPAEHRDIIVGYKIYYAKKDTSNSLRIAQGPAMHNLNFDNNPNNEFVWSGGNFSMPNFSYSEYDNEITSESFRIHDFSCLTNDTDISTITHLKTIGTFQCDGIESYTSNTSYTYRKWLFSDFVDDGPTWYNTTNSTYQCRTTQYIRSILATSYLENNIPEDGQHEINANQYGTTKDVYNFKGEKCIFTQLTSNLNTAFLVIPELQFAYGPPFSTPERAYFINMNSHKVDVHNSFDNQELVDTGYDGYFDEGDYLDGSGREVWGGDTFVGYYAYRTTSELTNIYQDCRTSDPIPTIEVKNMIVVPYEGRANVKLRHEGLTEDEIYYPESPAISASPVPDTGPGVLERPTSISNYFGYNQDYSRVNDILQPEIFSVTPTADNDSFPTRVIRSDTQSQESLIDSFRNFTANNYVDLDKTRGQIEIIKRDGTGLLIHLTNAITKTIARDILKTDATTAYIGNGDIFAIPSREILYSDIGIGGTQSQWANIIGPDGYFYPDQKNSKIFLLSNQLQEISANGMIKFFQEHMPFAIETQFPTVTFTNKDNPASETGLGYTAAWDNEMRRYLLTKRDFEMNSQWVDGFTGSFESDPEDPELYDIYFNTVEQAFYIYLGGGGIFNKMYYNNTTYFTDAGFTISYYPEYKSWGSFYDYRPNLFLYDNNNLFGVTATASTSIVPAIYKHNSTEVDRGAYYGADPVRFIVDIPFNEAPNKAKIFESVEFVSKYISEEGVEYPNQTFSAFNMYSSNSLSGETLITNLDTARSVNGTWYLNQFRDMRSSYITPILSEWNIVGEADPDKDALYQKRFFDNWMVCRLIEENEDNAFVGLIFNSCKARVTER